MLLRSYVENNWQKVTDHKLSAYSSIHDKLSLINGVLLREIQIIETLIEQEIPERPWVTVGIDLFELFSEEYVIVVKFSNEWDFE